MTKCSYCKSVVNEPLKIGPTLRFCNWDCYYKDCIVRHPGTALADAVVQMKPEIAKELGYNPIAKEEV